MLEKKDSYRDTYQAFRWDIPDIYNMGVDVCDKWAQSDPDRLAIHEVSEKKLSRDLSFGAMRDMSNRLANRLKHHGIRGMERPGDVGDRIGVLLPQCLETAVAHIAAWKMGCVSLPLFSLFGEEALIHRLKDSGARAVITNREGARKIASLRNDLPELALVLSIDGIDIGAFGFHVEIQQESPVFEPVVTRADDPALLIYTSGTTGLPKGALHGHRVLLGHLPGVEMHHDFLPLPGDKVWTPADWAWIGGLMDVLMPALHLGLPVVAGRVEKFTGEWAFDFIHKQGIRNAFLPPTALKLMRQVPEAKRPTVRMRSVGSGGEALGHELLDWGREVLGVTINEFYGQTECNVVLSSCSSLGVNKTGFIGKAVPGHVVEVIDDQTGDVMPTGEQGAIAVLSPDPVMFLRYWNRPDATAEKYLDGPRGKRWLLTGDQGLKDDEGYIQFVGRDDDVIGSAGYRIGPVEVEDCLLQHPAVQMAGVVAKPDPMRNAVVAAYILLSDNYEPSDDLADEIAQFVKHRLAAHEYPRVVRFIEEMPMTTSGKIIRASLRAMAQAEAKAEQEAKV
ncbi:AMP-dependent synthetase [Cohaesibacter sp. CAU 1516]|uniref:AMP-binding protein n=1 Tax=Cohaesibacter sp. CAU 1516 TaxID=2576038 RepID=UPI0010FF4BF8|nr:AMP-binding protein [Cohaesibacter sp. CAU 1516]TLP48561.1 AMP-dependent synthetase [Cohaesibacter sp. CAU 1516]